MILLGPCKLLKIEGDGKKSDDIHYTENRIGHYEIKIITDKGTFVIEGCGSCEAIFFEKEG